MRRLSAKCSSFDEKNSIIFREFKKVRKNTHYVHRWESNGKYLLLLSWPNIEHCWWEPCATSGNLAGGTPTVILFWNNHFIHYVEKRKIPTWLAIFIISLWIMCSGLHHINFVMLVRCRWLHVVIITHVTCTHATVQVMLDNVVATSVVFMSRRSYRHYQEFRSNTSRKMSNAKWTT